MTRISKIIILFLTFSLLTLSSYTFAQGTPNPCNDPDSGVCCDGDGNVIPPGDPACPIDGGLTALLIAGVGYGFKRVRNARKPEPK